MIDHRVNTELLLTLLDGATDANAIRRNGKPCRVVLPEDQDGRTTLVRAHLCGQPATLTFRAAGRDPWIERVDAVVLAAFCPGADARCRWIAIDLDAADHGDGGLADPVHATRTLAERADAAGLATGLLVARSRGGSGRHVWLVPPSPAPLEDAVTVLGCLVAQAYIVAARDVDDAGAKHAFRSAESAIAEPGAAGAVELFPRGTERPRFGWALTLPAAGAHAGGGGGIIVDPFTDQGSNLRHVPRCTPDAWKQFFADARSSVRQLPGAPSVHRSNELRRRIREPDPVEGASQRTRAFIEGRVERGARNQEAFTAACNLLGQGTPLCLVEREILSGAHACALPQHEAHSAIRSALRAVERPQ